MTHQGEKSSQYCEILILQSIQVFWIYVRHN